ncbi:PTS sugar transporter subunit IIA, partial [Enterococcus faecalis]|uniref:PTS sugar transporter subunit IIA n=1 Tax=Enterococcus faecalis TaxID=1351 RepID=UPI00403F598C
DHQAVRVIRADSKAQILATLADCFAAVYGLDAAHVHERILEREALGSTGFGRGVAIPHARIDRLTRPVAAFFRLEEPV